MTTVESTATTIQLPAPDYLADGAQLAAAAFLARYTAGPLVGERVSVRSTRTCARAGFIMALLDAGVPLRDVQIAGDHADPQNERQRSTTASERTSTDTPPTS